jgi:hypothetical protein
MLQEGEDQLNVAAAVWLYTSCTPALLQRHWSGGRDIQKKKKEKKEKIQYIHVPATG